MSPPIRLEKQNGIGAIILRSDGAGLLDASMRAGIAAALQAALADRTIRVILLAARGEAFPSALSDEDRDDQDMPSLRDLCLFVEASPKPVIATIQGRLEGPGVELVMAAHYRLASDRAEFRLNDISLGLIPQAGGTQRLPRLVGAENALDLLLSGRVISAGLAKRMGLIDEVFEPADLRNASLAFAQENLLVRPTQVLRHHFSDARQFAESVALFRAEVSDTADEDDQADTALHKIIDCIENAMVLPFDIAVDVEAEAGQECRNTYLSKALRHAAEAERKAAEFLELEDADPQYLEIVAVIGESPRGLWAAKRLLDIGYEVVLLASSQSGVETALEALGEAYESAVDGGLLSDGQGADILSRLTLTTDPDKIRDADLYLDTLNNASDKMELFAAVDILARPGIALVTTDVSPATLQKLQKTSNRTEDVIGVNFVDHFGDGRLAEIVVSPEASAQAAVTVHALISRMQFLPVRVGPQDGFVAEALWQTYCQVVDHLLLMGASIPQIDTAMQIFGFDRGPFLIRDELGLEMEPKSGNDPTLVRDALIEAGANGKTTGVGFYIYEDFKTPKPNPVIEELLAVEREAWQITPRAFSVHDIQEQVQTAFINCAVDLLESGVVDRACDIDAVALAGLNYPRERGGPTFESDSLTTFAVAKRLKSLQQEAPDFWQPSESLLRLAAERQKISDIELA